MEKSKEEQTVHIEDASSGRSGRGDHEVAGESEMNLQTYLALAAIASQYVAYLMTLLMPSTIVSYINADLGPDPNYTWINVSWNVAASVMVTVGGRLSDIFGRRYFIIAGAIIASCGALVGATAQSINQMIASGVLFGVGGGLQEMAFACVQEIVPNKHRIFAIGCFEATALPAFVSPMIAYAMLAKTPIGWRAVYWFLFSFELAGLALLILCYKPPTFSTKHRSDGKTRLQLLKQMDFIGVALFASGCISFLLGINWGGRKYSWTSAPVLATLVIGAVSLVALGVWEVYAKMQYPMLPPKLFRNVRGFTMVLVICFVGGMLYYSMNVLWPRQSALLFVPADDPIVAGVYANMVSFGSILAGLVTIFVCSKLGAERWQQVGFMVMQTALIGSLASVGVDDKVQAAVTIIVLASLITPPQLLAFVMISSGIEDQVDIGVASGLVSTFRLMGGAVATAIYSAILNNRFAAQLPAQIIHVAEAHRIPESDVPVILQAAVLNTATSYHSLLDLPNVTAVVVTEIQMAVKEAYVQAFRMVYLVAITFGGLAILSALFTRSIPKHMKTMQRAVKMENEVSRKDVEKT